MLRQNKEKGWEFFKAENNSNSFNPSLVVNWNDSILRKGKYLIMVEARWNRIAK
jgi:hypothetical protein